jgi:O-acetyl-ADP-ribose deacetylase (regulator of RNase III)
VPTLSIPLAFKALIGLVHDPGREIQRRFLVHVDSEAILDHLHRYLPSSADGEAATVGRLRLRFCVRDLLAIRADAIVNASNPSLKLGGGVSGAIRDAAHPALQVELAHLASRKALGPGEAVMTDAFGLQNCRRIVHAVTVGGRLKEVRVAIRNALELCDREHLASLAVPALGTGTGGMLVEDFTEALRAGVLDHLACHPEGSVVEMFVALWTRTDYNRAVARWRALDSASADSASRIG